MKAIKLTESWGIVKEFIDSEEAFSLEGVEQTHDGKGEMPMGSIPTEFIKRKVTESDSGKEEENEVGEILIDVWKTLNVNLKIKS